MSSVKKSKHSKHTKKYMRSGIDVSDIDKYYQDTWHDERMGGPASVKADDELFFVDKSSSGPEKPVVTEVKSRKQRALERPLRSLAILDGNQHIKPVITPLKNRKEVDPVDHINKLLEIKAQKPKHSKSSSKTPNKEEKIWNSEGKVPIEPRLGEVNEWCAMVERGIVTRTASKPERSTVASVTLPEGGVSYNPSYADHQSLLANALVAANKLQQSYYVDPATLPKEPSREAILKELVSGLADEDDEGDDNNNTTGAGFVPKPIKRTDKITRVEQNRRKRANAQRVKDTLAKETKTVFSQLHQLRQFNKEIDEEEAKKAERKTIRLQKREERMGHARKMSRVKVGTQLPSFKLTDELTPNLRSLRPEGAILRDRYMSLVNRNIVEYRTRAKKTAPKFKNKLFVKAAYRHYDEREREIEKAKAKKASDANKVVIRVPKASSGVSKPRGRKSKK